MKQDNADLAHLWDMLNAAREALSYVERVTEDAYLGDRMRQRALERTIEILGEAAGRVSLASKTELPGIDWRRITGQRVVLAHRYAKIDQALLYKTTRDKVPDLVGRLAELLGEEERR